MSSDRRFLPWKSLLVVCACLAASCSGGKAGGADVADATLDAADESGGPDAGADAAAPTVDLVVLPESLQGGAPLGTLDSTGCLDLCTWIDENLLDAQVEAPCIDLDTCLAFCAILPRMGERPCDITRAEYATCLKFGGAVQCRDLSDLVDAPECFPFGRCVLPTDDTLLSDTEHLAMRVLCNEMNHARAAAPSGTGVAPWADCLFGLQAFACGCDVSTPGAASPGCGVTVGNALECVAAAGPGPLPELPGCAPFRTEASGAYAKDARLVDLDCVQVRRLCQEAIPEQGSLAESPTCRPETGTPAADYRAAVETCVASIGSLKCHCDATPGGPGCDADIGLVSTCVEQSYLGECAYLAEGSCIAPANAASGLTGDVKVSAATPAQLRQWCSWRVCFAGGPGFAGHGCPNAAFATKVPDVDGCVADLTYHFASCDVTLSDVEQCLFTIHKNDACERLGTFGACTQTENKATAYVACHYMYFPECKPVVDCIAAGWDIPLEPPEGY